MAVEFGVFNRETSNLTELGTLKTIIGKGGKLALIRKNWEDKAKRVAVLLTNKAGKTAVVACSKQVSDSLRNGKLTIEHLVGLTVIESEMEDGTKRNFISMPATGAIKEIAIDSVTAKAVEAEVDELKPNELIAF